MAASTSTPVTPPTPLRSSTPSKTPFSPGARRSLASRLPPSVTPFDDGVDGSCPEDDGTMLPATTPFSKRLDDEGEVSGKILSDASTLTYQASAADAAGQEGRSGGVAPGFSMGIEQLIFYSRLAEGAYGVVWHGAIRDRPGDVAIKVQRVPLDEHEQANLLCELSILQSLVHPRLVRYEGAALVESSMLQGHPEWERLLTGPEREPEPTRATQAAWQADGVRSPRQKYMISHVNHPPPIPRDAALVLTMMELCTNGSLREGIRRYRGRLSWALKVRIARDVAEGLAFLHDHGLIHRDLKTSNILLDAKWNAKICDHSFVTTLDSPELAEFTCGTWEFVSPEVALGEPYDTKCDIFSLGVVLCELASELEPGTQDFLVRRAKDLFELNEDDIRQGVLPGCPSSLLNLALHCTRSDPEVRPSAEEAQEWAQSLFAELEPESVSLLPLGGPNDDHAHPPPAAGPGGGADGPSGRGGGEARGEGKRGGRGACGKCSSWDAENGSNARQARGWDSGEAHAACGGDDRVTCRRQHHHHHASRRRLRSGRHCDHLAISPQTSAAHSSAFEDDEGHSSSSDSVFTSPIRNNHNRRWSAPTANDRLQREMRGVRSWKDRVEAQHDHLLDEACRVSEKVDGINDKVEDLRHTFTSLLTVVQSQQRMLVEIYHALNLGGGGVDDKTVSAAHMAPHESPQGGVAVLPSSPPRPFNRHLISDITTDSEATLDGAAKVAGGVLEALDSIAAEAALVSSTCNCGGSCVQGLSSLVMHIDSTQYLMGRASTCEGPRGTTSKTVDTEEHTDGDASGPAEPERHGQRDASPPSPIRKSGVNARRRGSSKRNQLRQPTAPTCGVAIAAPQSVTPATITSVPDSRSVASKARSMNG